MAEMPPLTRYIRIWIRKPLLVIMYESPCVGCDSIVPPCLNINGLEARILIVSYLIDGGNSGGIFLSYAKME